MGSRWVYTCDRCGCEMLERKCIKRIYWSRVIFHDYGREQSLDLCSNCFNKLKDFLKSGEGK